MKVKKILLTCFLIASMIVSMGGCTPSKNSATATATDNAMTPYGKYKQKVTLSIAKRSSSAPNFLAGDTTVNNPMTRYITDKINVDFTEAWEVESTEYANKLALMIASNNLPDVFTLTSNDYLLYKQLVDNNLLADLNPGYKTCANDYIKKCFTSFKDANLKPFEQDGKLNAFAGGRYGYEHNLLWLRSDWMNELNLAQPKTVTDIGNILTAFVKAKGPQAAMILNAIDVSGVYSGDSASPIFASLGAYPGAWVKDKSGNIIWGSTAPEVKEGLKVLADWYKKGLIDKQFATRTAAGASDALFTGGKSGAVFAPWWYVYSIGDFPKNNPKADIMTYNAPLDSNGKYNIMWPGPSGDFICVSKKCAHPEAIIKVINCEFDMWREFDSKAAALILPTRNNNVDWIYMFPTSGFNLETADCIPFVGKLAKSQVEKGNVNGLDTSNIMDVNMAKSAATYAKTKVVAGMNWIDYNGRYIASNHMDTPEVNIVNPEYSFVTESMADLKPNLDTLEQTTFLQIVVGQKSIDAFDQFVKAWYAQGGQKLTDEVKKAVAATTK